MELPFQSIVSGGTQYKLHAIVTNMDWTGDRLISFTYERCGKLEEDLAGGRLPSGR